MMKNKWQMISIPIDDKADIIGLYVMLWFICKVVL